LIELVPDIPQVLHIVNSAADAVLQSCLSNTDLLSSVGQRFFETSTHAANGGCDGVVELTL
jgi:hypothetical protein